MAEFTVEILKLHALPPLRNAWIELSARSLEANGFLDPDFALPALRYLNPPQRLRLLVAFAANAPGERRLVALLPILLPVLPFGIARAYVHKQAALGTPLLDRELAAPALAAMIAGLKRLYPAIGALVFVQLPKQGPTLALVQAEVQAQQGMMRLFGEHDRAVLFGGGAPTPPGRSRLRRPRRNTRRQRRRLADRGDISYRTCRGEQAIDAMAQFLALEASGWKGEGKTALGSLPARAAFAAEVARLMGERDKLRIDSLNVDGKAVAMGIILDAGGRSYFWKTAYDETLAQLSPGVLFAREFTERQLAAGEPIILIDSCATPNHPMIDRLWSDRIAIADVGIALQPSRFFARITFAVEQLRRGLRQAAKTLFRREHHRPRKTQILPLRS